jgi:hypothetical protein
MKSECWAKGSGNEGGGPRRKPKNDGEKSNVVMMSDQTPDIEAWAVTEEIKDDAVPRVSVIAAQGTTDVMCGLLRIA